MLRFFGFSLLVLLIELGILFGVAFYFDYHLLSTMFFGSVIFTFIAYLLGSSGDALSKNSEVAVFHALAGRHQPKHEKAVVRLGPFLVGSIFCFIVYLGMQFLM
ncbi:hypothetical protein [Fredinandcohnia quinoae]|uniref:DUF3899 domain-containing protein n=1 Tax=Fredinandcohnia quinoae TaxID=2918902 RepID=A0AAW5DY57_9BACI|nr:hypothetical protein [Fredinandcohnia sp. SECRCQ15]MCH1625018.1 hypothetical protein [Fredinandcohnia sp. SECRCQ15]